QRGRQHPDLEAPVVGTLDRGEREHHRERAHEEDERRRRRERDVEDFLRPGPGLVGATAVEQVRGDERSEEQAVGGEEEPHRELRARDTGRRGVGIVTVTPRRRGRSADLGGLLDRRHGQAASSVAGSMPQAYTAKPSTRTPMNSGIQLMNTAAYPSGRSPAAAMSG